MPFIVALTGILVGAPETCIEGTATIGVVDAALDEPARVALIAQHLAAELGEEVCVVRQVGWPSRLRWLVVLSRPEHGEATTRIDVIDLRTRATKRMSARLDSQAQTVAVGIVSAESIRALRTESPPPQCPKPGGDVCSVAIPDAVTAAIAPEVENLVVESSLSWAIGPSTMSYVNADVRFGASGLLLLAMSPSFSLGSRLSVHGGTGRDTAAGRVYSHSAGIAGVISVNVFKAVSVEVSLLTEVELELDWITTDASPGFEGQTGVDWVSAARGGALVVLSPESDVATFGMLSMGYPLRSLELSVDDEIGADIDGLTWVVSLGALFQ